MRTRTGLNQRLDVRQNVQVDPLMVLRSQLLELPLAEIDVAIESELADNPALERLETDVEPLSEEQLRDAVAPKERRSKQDDHEWMRCSQSEELSPDSWVNEASSQDSLRDHVLAQIRLQLPKDWHTLAEYVVHSLNDKGYLDVSIEEISLANNVSLEAVQKVVKALHRCEPAGVGARNVQECLLLQLRTPESFEQALARTILQDHLDDLISRKTSRISKRHKVLPAVVEAAFEEILQLNPAPAIGFSNTQNSMFVRSNTPNRPDLTLTRSQSGWMIEPQGGNPSHLRVNPLYSAALNTTKSGKKLDADDRAHLSEFVGRAERFMQGLQDRRQTLRRIGEFLVQEQGGFISTGLYEFLQPLTRGQIAQELGVHESTVSRATMGKFVQIDTGEIIPFDVFFKPMLRVQKMIEEICRVENPATPLTDEQIAVMLAKKGVMVARRTVSKYRDRTRMLNSRTRRSA